MSATEALGGGHSGDSMWTSDTRGGGDNGDSARKHVECHRDAVCSPASATPCADRPWHRPTYSPEEFAHKAHDAHTQWKHAHTHAHITC